MKRPTKSAVEDLCREARALRAGGRAVEAIAAFKKVLAREPARSQAWLELVEIMLSCGMTREACRTLEQAARAVPPQDAQWHLKAKTVGLAARMTRGQPPALWAELQDALRDLVRSSSGAGPEASSVILSLAKKLQTAGRGARAAQLCEILVEDRGGDPARAATILAEVGFAGRARKGEDKALSGVLKKLARRVDGAIDRYRILLMRGEYRRAFALAEGILDAGLSVDQARVFAYPWPPSYIERSGERFREELSGLSRERAGLPWTLYYKIGIPGDGELDAAALRELARFPRGRYGWMHLQAGRALHLRRLYKEAVDWFARAAASKPLDWYAYGFMAEAELGLGALSRARRSLKKGIAAAPEPEKADAWAWLGAIELWLGNYPRALKHLDRARDGGARWSYCWRAGALVKSGRFAEALLDAEQALRVHPGDQEARIWLAEALRALRRPREALEALKDSQASLLWAEINRALACAELGDRAGLRRHYDRIAPEAKEAIAARTPGAPLETGLRVFLERAAGYRTEPRFTYLNRRMGLARS